METALLDLLASKPGFSLARWLNRVHRRRQSECRTRRLDVRLVGRLWPLWQKVIQCSKLKVGLRQDMRKSY